MRRCFLTLAALLLLTAAADAQPASQPAIVAQRGDVKLTAADVKDMLSRLDPAARAQVESSPATLATFVRDRLLARAMLEEARAGGWDQKPDVVQRANEARDAVVVQSYLGSLSPNDPAYPDDATLNAAYEANKTRFMLPRQYHLAQIVVLTPASASKDQEEEAHRKAADLRAQVTKPKADFAEVARKHSQEKSTADKGGDIGWVREDQLIPAVKDVVVGLPENGTSDPVRVPDGWHVLRVLGTRPAAPASLADVKPQLVQALRQARNQRAVNEHVEALLRQQPIQLNEIDLARQVSATP